LRPYLAICATGASFDEKVIRLRRDSTLSDIRPYSPSGRVPVLQIDDKDGTRSLVWDSLAICETLAERHPEAELWPSGASARATARSYAAEMHSGFADLRDQLPVDLARRLPTPELRSETTVQIARVLEAWTTALRAQPDGSYLFGRFSIADCMYAPVVTRFVTYGIQLPEPARTYCETMRALPAMRDWAAAAAREVEKGLS
jgi:glutathione S-transferase